MNAAYYNEHDPHAAAWLRELIAQRLIAPGDVDERSIKHVGAGDVAGYTQCHFFAGIGVWSYALRRAGWPDGAPVWTGSCPCQPFSASGKRKGEEDHRHLWPEWFRLIGECAPNVCFGEQVASKLGRAWLDTVSADLEGVGYAIGACDTCAAGVGAPHIRQRLYFVAESSERGRAIVGAPRLHEDRQSGRDAARRGASSRMADANRDGARQHARELSRDEGQHEVGGAHGDHASLASGAVGSVGDSEIVGRGSERERRTSRAAVGEGQRLERVGAASVLGDTDAARLQRCEREDVFGAGRRQEGRAAREPSGSPLAGFWAGAEWLDCRDGKARPVEPGTFPLVTGAPARVGRLRGYGNALCAPQAIAFIEAYLEVGALDVEVAS